MLRWLFMIVIAAGLGVGLSLLHQHGYLKWEYLSLTQASPAPPARPKPSRPAAADTATEYVFASGVVEGAQRNVDLRFEIAGRLDKVLVREGDRVKPGDVLARLDPATLVAKVSEAQANLELAIAERLRLVNGARPETRETSRALVRQAEARLSLVNKQWERGLLLRQKNAISQQDFDDLTANRAAAQADLDAAKSRCAETEAAARTDELQMADARIAVAKARIAEAKSMLDKTELRAPAAGLILRVLCEPGQMVQPISLEQQDPAITMVSVDETRVRAFVEELDSLRVFPEQRVIVTTDSAPDLKFSGTVVQCAPLMVPKRTMSGIPSERIDVKVREVLIRLDPQSQLVVGLPVDVWFDVGKKVATDGRGNGPSTRK